MGVVYIGDRETGKTALAVELIDPKKGRIKVEGQNYDNLKKILYDEDNQRFKATDIDQLNVIQSYDLTVNVELTSNYYSIPFRWVDTPGEIYQKSWQKQNSPLWQKFLSNIHNSEGIMLILPPYREMPYLSDHLRDEFPSQKQWLNRFERWVEFLLNECPKARHILLCLNKADLFTDVKSEAQALASKTWNARHEYIFYRYFAFAQEKILYLSRISPAKVRCFITTIHNHNLLELPWFYLASHLSTSTSQYY